MAATVLPSIETPPVAIKAEADPAPALTPPASVGTEKHDDASTAKLSAAPEAEEEEDIGEIEPDHYYNGGQIPVFKPTMKQFKSFPKFIRKIDKYGMQSGIVKVIPPPEWREALPALDEQVKSIKVKNPIMQEFHGAHGIYTQANIEKQRSYTLPQWKGVTHESNHQPPARRGERRRNLEKPVKTTSPRAPRAPRAPPPAPPAPGQKRPRGRPRKHPLPAPNPEDTPAPAASPTPAAETSPAPPAPASPAHTPQKPKKADKPAKSKSSGPKSVSSRRTHNSAAQVEEVDEAAFRDFNYRLDDPSEWTKERCEELEPQYWKSLNFNNPMYGADMPGSMFDDTTTSWNVAKLESLLDVLGQKVPGVNTAYLYLGMWKATFAWHLEDVDLYSINYIHFGAPKQWYSISQRDARKFEKAMKNIWQQDAKACDQFLRHKTYLVSPQILKSQYGVEVNRLVHYEGEFVITFPYGYHSGYNLGYNCAESVNFATEAWLEYGKIARKCNCEADSVWVDVYDIERKLRGEPTPEYFDEELDDGEDAVNDLPTPPGSDKDQVRPRKRKLQPGEAKDKSKRIRLTMGPPKAPVCTLCPSDPPFEPLLSTEDGKKAHRLCALYIPEPYLTGPEGSEIVAGVKNIDKKRRELRCLACRAKSGAVFQCSQKKCARAYHPTCAAHAGVSVEIGMTSFYGEDGTEYQDVGIDFRCRFHRAKRPKYPDEATMHDTLEKHTDLYKYGAALQKRELVQYQLYNGDIRCGYVLENHESEESLLIMSMPARTNMEISYKFLLFLEKSHQQLKPPSANALPLPPHLANRGATSQEDPNSDTPKQDDPFNDPASIHVWGEFRSSEPSQNPDETKVHLEKPNTLWHYLGAESSDSKARFTHDPSINSHNPASAFLSTVAPPTPKAAAAPKKPPGPKVKISSKPQVIPGTSKVAIAPAIPGMHQWSHADPSRMRAVSSQQWGQGAMVDMEALRNQQAFMASSTAPLLQVAQPRPRSKGHANRLSLDMRLAGMSNDQLLAAQQAHHHAHNRPRTTSTASLAREGSPVTPESSFTHTSSNNSVNTPPSILSLQREASASHKIWGRYSGFAHFQDWLENRPLVYKSPYGPPGVISNDYLPLPRAARPKKPGLAEAYFLSRSSSEQQVLQPHVRTVSTEKAQLHVQEAERRRQEAGSLFGDSRPTSRDPMYSAETSYFELPPADPAAPHPLFAAAERAQQPGFLADPAHSPPGSSGNAAAAGGDGRPKSRDAYGGWPPGYGAFQVQYTHIAPAPYQPAPVSLAEGGRPVKGIRSGSGLSINTGLAAHRGGYAYPDAAAKDGTGGSPLRQGRDGAGGETLPVMQNYHY